MKVTASGLVLNTKYPHLGASPDGMIMCDCCGIGCLEIKCPHCAKDDSPDVDGIVDYLERSQDGKLQLKQNHMYYYQVQAQMHICEVGFSDFTVWTPRGLHIERIEASKEFFVRALDNITIFYKYGVLPELIGKWYSKEPIMPLVDESSASASAADIDVDTTTQLTTTTDTATTGATTNVNVSADDTNGSVDLICYCKQPESGDMIGCDFPTCSIEWFHQSCLRIKTVPKGKWYCPDCRKLFKGRHPPKSLLAKLNQ